ncbi:MAG: NAD-dependent deacylase [Chitinophagaceae bacterium]|nr:NAD-dependent deacylase [Chitinophagaceae bacterium]
MPKKKLVVLSGAGISAESGLKTFRDSDGLWENYSIYDVATPEGFKKDPKLVLDFYNMRRKDVASAQPNQAHIGLARMEDLFDVHIVTQNIDDLHERAGSTKVLHLHGEIFKMRSVKNTGKIYEIRGDIDLGEVAEDGSQLRPHIVWFNEDVPMIETAISIIEDCDFFAVVGTSLLVYPAASLINYAPYHVPKFIIDKAIPYVNSLHNFKAIEMSASKGVKELEKQLKPLL